MSGSGTSLKTKSCSTAAVGFALLVGCSAPDSDAAARQAIQASSKAGQDAFRNSLKMPGPGRRIDPESARAAAKRVNGVRSVVWLDPENLLVIVRENAQRSNAMVDQICTQLEPLGDTPGVVVNLQSGAAANGDALEILSRNCQLDPGERGVLQQNRQAVALSASIRAQRKASKATQ